MACHLLEQHGAAFSRPRGAFYLMLDVSASGLDDMAFCKGLLQRHGVALAPGSTFGEVSRGWARVSLAASDEHIRIGIGRAAAYLAELAAQHAPVAAR